MDREMDMDIDILKEKLLISDIGTALISEKETFVWLDFLQHWTRKSDGFGVVYCQYNFFMSVLTNGNMASECSGNLFITSPFSPFLRAL